MNKLNCFFVISLLMLGSFLNSAQGVSSIPPCVSSISNSYQMQKGETLFSLSHGLKGEYITMYVPVPAQVSVETNPGENTSMYYPIASNPVPDKPVATIGLMNQRLAQGDTIFIYYEIKAGENGNYYFHVSAKAGSDKKDFYKAEPILLTSSIPLGNGTLSTDPFPAKEEVVNNFDVEPATPFSIPFILITNSAKNIATSGSLCFSGQFDSVKGWTYIATFTIVPAQQKGKAKNKHAAHRKIKKSVALVSKNINALLKIDSAPTIVNASKIVGVLKSNSYTAADWGKYICPALNQAPSSMSLQLKKYIAQEMGLPATAYPCTYLM